MDTGYYYVFYTVDVICATILALEAVNIYKELKLHGDKSNSQS